MCDNLGEKTRKDAAREIVRESTNHISVRHDQSKTLVIFGSRLFDIVIDGQMETIKKFYDVKREEIAGMVWGDVQKIAITFEGEVLEYL